MCTKSFYIFHKLLKICVKLQTFIWKKKNKTRSLQTAGKLPKTWSVNIVILHALLFFQKCLFLM